MPMHPPYQADYCIASQTNLALLAASCRQHCYLEAIRAEVPELVEKDKMGDGVQGEPDLSGKIVQDNLETEEWGAVLGCRYGH
jgi:hypothetical protein